MQQQPPQLCFSPPPPSPPLPFSPNTITTEQIQKCLDDNKYLILAILENQNLGKVSECAHHQAVLQRNLMYLAAIADAQPAAASSTTPSQLPPNPSNQQGSYVQQAHNPMLQSINQGVPGQKLLFELNALRTPELQHQLLHFQAQQQFQGQPGANQGMHQSGQAGLASKQTSLDANSGGGGK